MRATCEAHRPFAKGCADCRAAMRVYLRAYRIANRRAAFHGREHGRVATYGAGCRCRHCTKAVRLYNVDRRRRVARSR